MRAFCVSAASDLNAEKKSERVQILITKSTKEKLDALAGKIGVSRNEMISRIIEKEVK